MANTAHGGSERPVEADFMSPAEKLACEWEARHDVAARGKQIDPAGALQRYLGHARCEDLLHDHPHHEHPRTREEDQAHRFAAEHPLAGSWLRWGEDRR
jgi:hypothetical protein